MSDKLTIICVDDEQTVLNSLESELRGALGTNVNIEYADSASYALELLNELDLDGEEVAVVMSDYIMPGKRGDELLASIHKLRPEIRKIMLTGQADLQAVANVVNEAGLFRYISKPWDKHDLLLTLQSAIDAYKRDRELVLTNRAYRKFVPHEFLKHLNKKSILDVNLGDQIEKEMTVMFTDIRGFTSISQDMTPAENFNFINSYLGVMEPIIAQHNGFIDKYVGDGLMVLFDGSPADAIGCADSMLVALQYFNDSDSSSDFPPIEVGIGRHVGSMMLGTVGSENRMDSTVISDAVNTASRIEHLTKSYLVSVIFTEAVYERLNRVQRDMCRLIDHAAVSGRNKVEALYEYFGADDVITRQSKKQYAGQLREAIEFLNTGHPESAAEILNSLRVSWPSDPVVRFHVARTEQL